MTDTTNSAPATTPDAPQGTDAPVVNDAAPEAKPETDWKAEARKWESRAKENKTASDELAKIREAQMSEAEKSAKALADATARAQTAEINALRFRIAAKNNISDEDAELFLTATDEETMTRQAERFVDRSPSGPRPNPAQGRRGGNPAPTSNAERFAQAMEDLF